MAIVNKEDYGPRETVIDLTGPQGNAFFLIGAAKRFARQLNFDYEPIKEEMTSGNYDHLVETFDSYFGDYVTLLR